MRHWGVVIVYAFCFGCFAVLCSEQLLSRFTASSNKQ